MTDTPPTGAGPHIARLPSGSRDHNAVVMRTVELWFQKSPGVGSGREIRGLRYRLRREGTIVQQARTSADGKITFRAPPGETIVELLVGTRVAAAYRVTVGDERIPAITAAAGQQRRLRMLGYQLGRDGPSGDGVDGRVGGRTERAILCYQADRGIAILGDVDAATRDALNNDVVV